jgi:DHA1 family bicyclomycin/chloramphenicol resistance-like MFS transporter
MFLDNRKLIALLVALSAFGPMSMSIYTPAMTTIGHALMASDSEVKLTLTTFLIGFSAGQILYGPLSDKYGRRPVLLVGAAVYTLMGLACAFAPTVQELIILRIFHGLGVCSGAVISRAIVRDTFGHQGSA